MKKLLVYPFTKDMCPLARYRDMLEGYELTSAVPAKGFGWEGRDACELDGGAPTGIILGGVFSDELELCDAVLLNYGGQEPKKDHAGYEVIARASAKKLTAAFPGSIPEPEEDLLPDMPLWKIPVPVIMVMGQGENCQKFDIQLGLRKAFRREGYRVSQFGTKAYSGLFGFRPLPRAPEVPLWKKVYLYNRLFRETCDKESPDVMIVGVPGGIMPINSYAYELFGETALALASAARPDITLLSYYFIEPNQEYFELLRQYARFRLGAGEVHFHASNTKFVEERSQRKLGYLTLESRFVLQKLTQFESDPSTCLFNALVLESSGPAYRGVIEKLQQNVRVL